MLHWYACGADGLSGGRSVGRSVGHVITKFSWMGSLPHFLTRGAPLRALRARELARESGSSHEKFDVWPIGLKME